jgi:hypothetical protein
MDDGFAPSVAASGTTVVQVHQATNAEGPLWYRTGQLGRNGRIHWNGSSSVKYEDGFAPSVGTSGAAVVEIHQGDPGTLLVSLGTNRRVRATPEQGPCSRRATHFSGMARLQVAAHDLIVAGSFTRLPGPGNTCPIDAWSKKVSFPRDTN